MCGCVCGGPAVLPRSFNLFFNTEVTEVTVDAGGHHATTTTRVLNSSPYIRPHPCTGKYWEGRKNPGGIKCASPHLRMSMLQPAIFSRGAVDKMAGNILLRNALADQCTVFGITHDYALGEQGSQTIYIV